MLTQEELDKLLNEEAEGAGSGDEADKQAEPATQDNPEASSTEQEETGAQADGGDQDIDWADAFKEAAEGGDAAAAKAVEEGSVTEEPPSQEKADVKEPEFGELEERQEDSNGIRPELDFLLEIPLDISVELGRRSMKIKELLQLSQGSVVELNKMAGEPADIYVNKKLMAKGEVVVVNEKFGIKLTEIISPAERVRSLG